MLEMWNIKDKNDFSALSPILKKTEEKILDVSNELQNLKKIPLQFSDNVANDNNKKLLQKKEILSQAPCSPKGNGQKTNHISRKIESIFKICLVIYMIYIFYDIIDFYQKQYNAHQKIMSNIEKYRKIFPLLGHCGHKRSQVQ